MTNECWTTHILHTRMNTTRWHTIRLWIAKKCINLLRKFPVIWMRLNEYRRQGGKERRGERKKASDGMKLEIYTENPRLTFFLSHTHTHLRNRTRHFGMNDFFSDSSLSRSIFNNLKKYQLHSYSSHPIHLWFVWCVLCPIGAVTVVSSPCSRPFRNTSIICYFLVGIALRAMHLEWGRTTDMEEHRLVWIGDSYIPFRYM